MQSLFLSSIGDIYECSFGEKSLYIDGDLSFKKPLPGMKDIDQNKNYRVYNSLLRAIKLTRKTFPTMSRKRQLICKGYHEIDSQMNVQYFNGSALETFEFVITALIAIQ